MEPTIEIPINRTTKSHLKLKREAFLKVQGHISDTISCTSKDVMELMNNIRSILLRPKVFDFDDPHALSDTDYRNTVRLSKGYILSVLSPLLSDSKNNYASIITHSLLNNYDILKRLEVRRVIVVDRGFPDAVSVMEKLGFFVVMPSFWNRRKQLSTPEANKSRCFLVTDYEHRRNEFLNVMKAWLKNG
ncbi:unnamed protein product [Didymodactylos carnosus]|uniref:Uncharacterized protein n=1 Tax=Didymodactylos carnosus TaxID=1234261 RepID=A0A8S2DT42_9BILA|nr:unnamed protein product [Didymodactylos carnosus]CAF3740492.1 unnamed protein product [Didymodactylos carnosus]